MTASGRIFRTRETSHGIHTDIAYAEKRAAVRRPLVAHARLQKEGTTALLPARTVDISSTGVCLLVGQSLPFNEPWNIQFELYLDGQTHAVSLLAEVQQMIVATDGVRIGFLFKRMNMASMIAISRFVGEGAAISHF